MKLMIFEVSYNIKCKSGFWSDNEFYYKHQGAYTTWDEVEDDIFGFVNQFPWHKLEFEYYSDPDIRLINDNPSKSEIIRANQDFDRNFMPELRRMHKKNGTLRNNNSGGGGGGIPTPVKIAAAGYAGYKVGKSDLTG